ncbi:MAG: hypothetical protein AMXMBFR82_07070 [Candidatus Hydrogenedentota bacterium]
MQDARDRQRIRYKGRIACNARLDSGAIREHCPVSKESERLLENVMDEFGLSARAYDKILRVARTIADVKGAEHISEMHVAEAVHYRSMDRHLP